MGPDRPCRRSPGAADQIAREAESEPTTLAVLVTLMSHSDPLIAMRAADATEKATRTTPGALAAHRTQLFELAERSIQQEVRWHLAQLLPRLPLDEAEARRVGSLLEGYLADPSQIVRQGPVGQGRSRWQTHQRRAS